MARLAVLRAAVEAAEAEERAAAAHVAAALAQAEREGAEDAVLHARLSAVSYALVGGPPRVWQLDAAAAHARGRDTFVVWPAGGGKTLVAFASALHRPGITIFIGPLASLQAEQAARLQRYPQTLITGEVIYGGEVLGGELPPVKADLAARLEQQWFASLAGKRRLPRGSREAAIVAEVQARLREKVETVGSW